MYAEIKSNNKIIINRLDDTEKILLKDICDKANEEGKKIKLTSAIDETGEFGGVFLEVEDIPAE